MEQISTYSAGRKQYKEICNIKSNMLSVTVGVPQRSILGPLYSSYTSMILHKQVKCLTFSFMPTIQLYQVH